MDAIIRRVSQLTDSEVSDIVGSLTNEGSEFQQECSARLGMTPVAIVRDGSGRVLAWSATHEWNGMQTLEGFTSLAWRRRGLAKIAAAMLAADGHLETDEPVAVFSPDYLGVARAVGFGRIKIYEQRDGNWQEIS